LLLIKENNQLHIVQSEEILWIELADNQLFLYKNGRKYTVNKSSREIISLLDKNIFVRIHKNYIVRIDKIDFVNSKNAIINIGEVKLPIEKKYKADFLAKFTILK